MTGPPLTQQEADILYVVALEHTRARAANRDPAGVTFRQITGDTGLDERAVRGRLRDESKLRRDRFLLSENRRYRLHPEESADSLLKALEHAHVLYIARELSMDGPSSRFGVDQLVAIAEARNLGLTRAEIDGALAALSVAAPEAGPYLFFDGTRPPEHAYEVNSASYDEEAEYIQAWLYFRGASPSTRAAEVGGWAKLRRDRTQFRQQHNRRRRGRQATQ